MTKKFPYADIMNLQRPKSRHKKMSPHDRAAQFAPFAALTGYAESIQESSRNTLPEYTLSVDEQEAMTLEIQAIITSLATHPEVEVTFFMKDGKKEGGSYGYMQGRAVKYDETERWIKVEKEKIYLDDIVYIRMQRETSTQ